MSWDGFTRGRLRDWYGSSPPSSTPKRGACILHRDCHQPKDLRRDHWVKNSFLVNKCNYSFLIHPLQWPFYCFDIIYTFMLVGIDLRYSVYYSNVLGILADRAVAFGSARARPVQVSLSGVHHSSRRRAAASRAPRSFLPIRNLPNKKGWSQESGVALHSPSFLVCLFSATAFSLHFSVRCPFGRTSPWSFGGFTKILKK